MKFVDLYLVRETPWELIVTDRDDGTGREWTVPRLSIGHEHRGVTLANGLREITLELSTWRLEKMGMINEHTNQSTPPAGG